MNFGKLLNWKEITGTPERLASLGYDQNIGD